MTTEKAQLPAPADLAPAANLLQATEATLTEVVTGFFDLAEQQGAAIIAKYDGVVWQHLETGKGMQAAVEARAELRTFRTGIVDKGHAAIKAPLLTIGRIADDRKKALGDRLKAAEKVVDDKIKAEEARKAAEKAERERLAEEARIAAEERRQQQEEADKAKAELEAAQAELRRQREEWDLEQERARIAEQAQRMVEREQADHAEQPLDMVPAATEPEMGSDVADLISSRPGDVQTLTQPVPRPSAEELVMIVAEAKKVPEDVAYGWLIASFGSKSEAA